MIRASGNKAECAYQGVRNVRFSENLACFVFLKHPFLDSPFCLITDELPIKLGNETFCSHMFSQIIGQI